MQPEKVTRKGQIKEGDVLWFKKKNGCVHIGQAKKVINSGKDEEILLTKNKNDYFILDMYLDGKSWVSEAYILPDTSLTTITNNMNEFAR